MPTIEKISVALPADMLALVRAAVGSGGLATPGRHALNTEEVKREGRRRLPQTRASGGQRGK